MTRLEKSKPAPQIDTLLKVCPYEGLEIARQEYFDNISKLNSNDNTIEKIFADIMKKK